MKGLSPSFFIYYALMGIYTHEIFRVRFLDNNLVGKTVGIDYNNSLFLLCSIYIKLGQKCIILFIVLR